MQISQIGRLTEHLLALLETLVRVDDIAGLRQFVAIWHRLMPDGTRTILVVDRGDGIRVMANEGWDNAWLTGYFRSDGQTRDPVWNGPQGELLLWSRLLSVTSDPLRRKFIQAAANNNMLNGVSWVEQRGDVRLVISFAGVDVERDPLSLRLVEALAPAVMDVAFRLVYQQPDLTGLDKRDCHILQHMLNGLTDDEIADEVGVSVRTVRDRINKIRGLHAARNRIDLVRRLFNISPISVQI
ncbi:helix-turn-helix transcriptional regulator [Chromobacterium piscinae]|uniref:helix-turn-helix domain-containing protein n=1 Tax=Chromobacterium piscinae TaxID=686831 RepID=UPI001E2F9369|nr:helix-turn-helix transcriptional regulator [Chromobacterium piscinae]MCD5326812.1 helix-turn-helix transcriptional regulator [Chromobacterium piscinae]